MDYFLKPQNSLEEFIKKQPNFIKLYRIAKYNVVETRKHCDESASNKRSSDLA